MGNIIIDHNHPDYIVKRELSRSNKWNGAYYYSVEIGKYFIPNIKTDRNWITVNLPEVGADHSIVFIHNNLHPEWYEWLSKYKDLILVCGVPETMDKVRHLGKPIYLPLSVDVREVAEYRVKEKTKNVAFAGRREKRLGSRVPMSIDYIEGLDRPNFLRAVAPYRKVYCVGRTAIECRILSCEILPYDKRFPDPSIWEIVDSSEAAQMLQVELNRLDS